MDSTSPIVFLAKKSPKQKKDEVIKPLSPELNLTETGFGFEKNNFVEFLENIFQDVLTTRKIDREDKHK